MKIFAVCSFFLLCLDIEVLSWLIAAVWGWVALIKFFGAATKGGAW